MAKPPLRIVSQKKPVLTFFFQTFPLFQLNAKEMVQRHHACMYPLLPTMRNVNADLMEQAMRELVEIYQNEKGKLAEQFVWMRVFLDRTTTIKQIKKEQIKARLNMFEQLFDESPTIQKIREQYLIKGRQEGIQKGLQKGIQEGGFLVLQDLLVSSVQARYPDLTELARASAGRSDQLGALKLLIEQVMTAPNADAVRCLLEAGTA
jgi:predicted transposase YdaD